MPQCPQAEWLIFDMIIVAHAVQNELPSLRGLTDQNPVPMSVNKHYLKYDPHKMLTIKVKNTAPTCLKVRITIIRNVMIWILLIKECDDSKTNAPQSALLTK